MTHSTPISVLQYRVWLRTRVTLTFEQAHDILRLVKEALDGEPVEDRPEPPTALEALAKRVSAIEAMLGNRWTGFRG